MWGRGRAFHMYSSLKVTASSNWVTVRREANRLPLLPVPQGGLHWFLVIQGQELVEEDQVSSQRGARLYSHLLESNRRFLFLNFFLRGCHFPCQPNFPNSLTESRETGPSLLPALALLSVSVRLLSSVYPPPRIIFYPLQKPSRKHPRGQ